MGETGQNFEILTPETSTPTTPESSEPAKKSIGAGGVVGIVLGSVAVCGIGGFSVFWFVLKKKTFADLIGVFKKK